MTIVYLDCETTGLPEKGAKWEEDFEKFPHVVQLAWIKDDGTTATEYSYIIRPEGWEIPEEATSVHGISTAEALARGVRFTRVVGMFINDCLEADLLVGHNIYFDISVIKANIVRELGRPFYERADCEEALHKGKRIDTMRNSMKWADARTADGRLKFPRLEELYSRCFPSQSFSAHDALEDTRAVRRCLPILVEKGLVELKRKEYPAEQLELPLKRAETGGILGETQADNKVIAEEKNAKPTGFLEVFDELIKDTEL